jgi:hypothetical protein
MHQLEQLADRLLREGVAYRHVRRYVAELRDHYDDALRAEIAKGKDAERARAAALDRIGSLDDLAREMISKPELRALSAKYPRLWGISAPVAVWLGVVIVVVLSIVGLLKGLNASGAVVGGARTLGALQTPADVFLFLLVRVLPVIVGCAMLIQSIKQRAAINWALVGVALLAILGGAADAAILFSLTRETPSEFRFGAGISWDAAARSAALFALMLTPLTLKKRFVRPMV